MEITPEYETFGREVDFDEIKNVKKIIQPGILSKSFLFNPEKLKWALQEISWQQKEEIAVYFRNVAGDIEYKDAPKKGNWFDMLHLFKDYLGNEFPAGLKMEYWHNPDNKHFSSSEFKKDNTYQAFLQLFNNAIQGFSCFVRENEEGIKFSSHRTNYENIKPGEALIDDQKTLWIGNREDFLQSAYDFNQAIKEIGKTKEIEFRGHNNGPMEVRIISPLGKALVGRLVEDSSVTLLIDHASLEQIVKEHNQKRHVEI